MKTLVFQDRESWLAARMGKITGSRLKDIVVKRGTGKKIGFFELIAEKVCTNPYEMAMNETPMERGTRLEPEAMERFAKETGLKVNGELVMWTRDDTDFIAVSPDGFIGKTGAIEIKCLSSSRHIEAYVKKFIWNLTDFASVPDEYKMQAVQYFIVNDKLKTLYMVFYDPRITVKDYFVLTIDRKDVEDDIEEYKDCQFTALAEIDEIVTKMTF